MHLSSTGSAAYGFSTVAIDGSIPAALSGQVAGCPSGPGWLNSTTILYQSGGTGGGPWILQSYDTNTSSTATVDSAGANAVYAGSSVWAAFLSGSGVRTSFGGFLPFASSTAAAQAGLAYVSPDGEIAAVTNYAQGTGLTVYDASGTSILSLPTVAITSPYVRLHDHYLSYADTTGWHLVNVTTGAVPDWFPRIDGVVLVHPVLVGSTLYVVELTNTQLTIRSAARGTGYVVEDLPDAFWPTAQLHNTGVVRLGFSTNQAETVTSAVLVDVTVATGANTRGVVSGGTIVFTPQPTLSAAQFPLGPPEGSDLTQGLYQPLKAPVTDANGLMTLPWAGYLRSMQGNLSTVSTTVQHLPIPQSAPNGYGAIAVSGQPSVVAPTPNAPLTFTSADSSVTFTLNPVTQAVDFAAAAGGITQLTGDVLAGPGSGSQAAALSTTGVSAGTYGDSTHVAQITVDTKGRISAAANVAVSGGGGGGSWIPTVDGAEPPAVITDGAGVLMLVAYP